MRRNNPEIYMQTTQHTKLIWTCSIEHGFSHVIMSYAVKQAHMCYSNLQEKLYENDPL